MSDEEKTQKDVLQEIADSHRASQQEQQAAQQEPSGNEGEKEQKDEAIQQPAEAVVTPSGTTKRAKAERPPVEF
jgi:hypothetical protein